SGHVTDLTGTVLPLETTVQAPAGTLADGDMLVALAAALGIDIPTPYEIEQHALGATSPALAFGDASLCGSERAARGAQGPLRIAIAAHPFASQSVRFDERLHELRARPSATFSPGTAAQAGVAEGDLVDVVAGERIVHDLLVRVDDGAIDGAISIVDGLPEAPANDMLESESVALQNIRRLEPVGVGVI
ncbi:MAG TPA: hypothetical protein VKG44_06355, partial [Candidatus Baltobacteraceae bacterium]|nr:hypothetical protein [Candidatus Baltobacteraceae bacterium]